MGRELASDLTSPSAEQILPSGDRPSRTSQLVALTRANLDRPHTPDGDPDAQRRLCAGMRPPPDGWLRPDLAARTRFFDEQVLSAIAANVGQIVILGAGYDDRALRFRSPAVRYFELDHPATQADKAGRLLTLETETDRLVLAPADFREDDVAVVLAAAGHDASTPSLFICEGLLVYLDDGRLEIDNNLIDHQASRSPSPPMRSGQRPLRQPRRPRRRPRLRAGGRDCKCPAAHFSGRAVADDPHPRGACCARRSSRLARRARRRHIRFRRRPRGEGFPVRRGSPNLGVHCSATRRFAVPLSLHHT